MGGGNFKLGENESTQQLTLEKWIGYWFDCRPGRLKYNFAINTSMSDHIHMPNPIVWPEGLQVILNRWVGQNQHVCSIIFGFLNKFG